MMTMMHTQANAAKTHLDRTVDRTMITDLRVSPFGETEEVCLKIG